MNYVKQMNGFLERTQFYEISPAAVTLYVQLFRLFNKAEWPAELSPSAHKLQGLSGLNDTAFARARQELIDNGYINAVCTADKSGYTYSLIEFGFVNETEEVEADPAVSAATQDLPNKRQVNEKQMTGKRQVNGDNNNIYNNKYIYKQNKTREKQKPPQAAAGLSQKLDFVFVEKIELFKKSYPDKVDSNYLSYLKYKDILPSLDIQLLINKINESAFLKNNKNLNLSWLLENHLKVVNGYYSNFDKPQNTLSNSSSWVLPSQRKYSPEELQSISCFYAGENIKDIII